PFSLKPAIAMARKERMTFQESIRVCLTKYADFSGTASRAAASAAAQNYGTIFFLATLLPLLAAGARRLHDTGRSGWLQLMGLIPVAGNIILIVFLAQEPRETAVVREPAS